MDPMIILGIVVLAGVAYMISKKKSGGSTGGSGGSGSGSSGSNKH